VQCGNCRTWREATITHVDAVDFRARLTRQHEAIARELEGLDRARMGEQGDAFIAALRDGTIVPADFAR